LPTSLAMLGMCCILLMFSSCSKKASPPEETVFMAEETTPPAGRNENFTQSPKMVGYVSAVCINVRRSPGTQAPTAGHLFKGDRINIYEEQRSGGGVWYRMNDAAGYVAGWVSGRFVSGAPVKSDFTIPADYKEPRTPSVVTGVTAKYVGVEACRTCHNRPHGEFQLGEHGVWSYTYHNDAYKTLTRAYTRAIAKKRGVDDPVNDWRCKKCHVTAYGVPAERLGPDYSDEDGVGCEACHGPGGDYLLEHWEGKPGYANREAMGFRIFKDVAARENLCRSCHNELSPTYKPFNIEAFSAAIRHWQREYDYEKIAEELNKRAPAAEQAAKVPPKPIEPPPSTAPLSQEVSPPVVTTSKPAASQETSLPPTTTPVPAASRGASSPPVATPEPAKTEAVKDKPAPASATPAPPTTKPAGKSIAVPARLASVPRNMTFNKNGMEKGEVFFPHLSHNKYVKPEKEAENCQVCHHTTKAGAQPVACGDCHKLQPTIDTPNREKAFHGTCRNCHQEEQAGPQKCSECHST